MLFQKSQSHRRQKEFKNMLQMQNFTLRRGKEARHTYKESDTQCCDSHQKQGKTINRKCVQASLLQA